MKNKALLLMVAVLVVLILLDINSYDLGILLITLLALIGYFTGILAIGIGLALSLFAFIVSLPLISTLYGFIVFSLARIHYMLFTVVAKKTLKKSKAYRKMELNVKSNRTYKKLSKIFNRVLLRAGIAAPHRVKFIEIKNCKRCDKLIPKDGRFCPYCGNKQ